MLRAIAFILLGAVLACVALELLFRILPVSTSTAMGYYVDDRILTYPPHHRFTTATGWDLENPQTHTTNNVGFVASRDFTRDPSAVALIGDSFVEASMLSADARLGERLERDLLGRPVYAMGAPGSSLLDYAERIRFAATKFAVRDFVVVIEEGDVLQAFCGSGQVHGSCYDEHTSSAVPYQQPPPGLLKRILRHSAFAQYFTSQLKLDPGALLRAHLAAANGPATAAGPAHGSTGQQPTPEQSRQLAQIIAIFFAEVAPYHQGRLILVLEDRTVSGSPRSSLQQRGRDLLVEAAQKAGAAVIDTGPVFRQFTTATGLAIAVSPRDHHWNPAATGLVADQVAQVFSAQSPSNAASR